MPKLSKGQITPLNVTQEARWRVFAGLGWDPREDITLMDKAKALAGGKPVHHDLDLACYIFDVNGHYIGHVSTEEGRETDQTGKIYHSGDNIEGMGDGDDEQVSIELKDLDSTIRNIIIVASIKTGHAFAEVNEPEIHLSDGYTGHSFLKADLANLEGSNDPAFIFARLFKNPEDQWMLHNVSEFCAQTEPKEWPEILKAYARL